MYPVAYNIIQMEIKNYVTINMQLYKTNYEYIVTIY